jgi:hypothetical protein
MNDANFMRKRDQKELEKSEKHHWLSDRLYNNRIEDRDWALPKRQMKEKVRKNPDTKDKLLQRLERQESGVRYYWLQWGATLTVMTLFKFPLSKTFCVYVFHSLTSICYPSIVIGRVLLIIFIW